MAYGADFATADPANAPLDAPLMIGADPVLWGALLLGLIAAALAGWYFGQGARSARVDAADSIWEEIDDAAKDAMKADGDSLSAKASALARTIERRLGKTLGVAGGAGKLIKALNQAVKGEPADKPHAPHAEPGHGAGHGGTHEEKPGHHGAAPVPACGVTVIVNSGQADGQKPADDGHGDHHGKKLLTVQERNDALRVAIGHFNDHWGLRRERVRDLRAAHAELSTPGPKRPATGKVSGTRASH